MTADKLLVELEGLTHSGRIQRMVELGRESLKSSTKARQIQATLTQFSAGDFYQKSLALYACQTSGDGPMAARLTTDNSRCLRRAVLAVLADIGSDEQILAALSQVANKLRRRFLLQLVTLQRFAVIDAFLSSLHQSQDREFAGLLPYGSAALVEKHFAAASPIGGLQFWKRLTRRHPELATTGLVKLADGLTERADYATHGTLHECIEILAPHHPDHAVGILQALAKRRLLASYSVQPVIPYRPQLMADLVLASPVKVAVVFSFVVARLTDETILELLEKQPETLPINDPEWIENLTPERFAKLYAADPLRWRHKDGTVALAVLRRLPYSVRLAEAQRILSLPNIAAKLLGRLPFVGLLSWDEANTAAEKSIGHAKPEYRAATVQVLIGVAKFDLTRRAEALALVTYRHNEQDPIRQVMLEELTRLPRAGWKEEHLDALGEVVRAALDAVDLSTTTAMYCEQLVGRLFAQHPTWAAKWLAIIIRERGSLGWGWVDKHLTDADVLVMAPHLLPILKDWKKRERDYVIISLATNLGRRLKVFTALVEMLEKMALSQASAVPASAALSVLHQFVRQRIPELIPRILALDGSWICNPIVAKYLHRQRQDLLTPFLGRQTYKGRFSTGKTYFVLAFETGFHRWTQSQRDKFAKTLADITRKQTRAEDTPTNLQAIRQLASIPGVDPTRVIELAADEHKAIREFAIQQLGRLDGPEGLPALVAAMEDDRARRAIYALRACLMEMPATQAMALLQTMPMRKVTVAKEVVRLVGELNSADSYPFLLRMLEKKLHKDVRVALLRGLWDHLEKPQTWDTLDQAAATDDPSAASVLARIPTDRLSVVALARLRKLFARLLTSSDTEVRAEALERWRTSPIRDPEAELFPVLVGLLDLPAVEDRQIVVRAIIDSLTSEDLARTRGIIEALMPNRRTLAIWIEELHRKARYMLSPYVRLTLEVLATDPCTVTQQVQLSVHLPWKECVELWERIDQAGAWLGDTIAAGEEALKTRAGGVDRWDLDNIEKHWATSPSPTLRRFAVIALIVAGQSHRGWRPERIIRLKRFATDPMPSVAATAQSQFPDELAQASEKASG
jgi:hypothetical protein